MSREWPEHVSKYLAEKGGTGQLVGQPGIRQLRQDSQDRTSGTGQPGQVGLKIQPGQVRLDRQRGQDAQHMTARRPGQASWDRTVRIGKLGDKSAGKGSWDMPAREDSWDRTTVAGQSWLERYNRSVGKDRAGQLGQDIQERQPWQERWERTARIGQGQLGQGDQHGTNAAGKS